MRKGVTVMQKTTFAPFRGKVWVRLRVSVKDRVRVKDRIRLG